MKKTNLKRKENQQKIYEIPKEEDISNKNKNKIKGLYPIVLTSVRDKKLGRLYSSASVRQSILEKEN